MSLHELENELAAAMETGAVRESIGTKIDTTLVPYEMIAAAAMAFNYGANKYSSRNYEKGLSYRFLCGSIDRHNKAILDGEYTDADSRLPHYALLVASAAMLCHNILQDVIVDDRPQAKKGLDVAELAVLVKKLETEAAQARDDMLVSTGAAK
jgi:hypothetical protein